MMTTAEAAQHIHDALVAAMSGDIDQAAHHVATLGTDSDASRMYNVVTTFAEAGHRALLHMYGDKAPKPGTDEMWAILQLKPGALEANSAQAWATRFLVAHCNGDPDAAKAQFETALVAGPEVFVGGVCCLVADVAGLANTALRESEAQGG
ncbi:hypothetical protein ACFY64_31510 [Streptomyces collinus]|uniref:hypothetical protein n=1 Tax=Streptomyces collinus TaxID=42684 RepID=UPI00368850D5